MQTDVHCMSLLLHGLTCCIETLVKRRPCFSLVIIKRVNVAVNCLPAPIRLGAADTDGEEGAWKVSLFTTVYNVRHELAISREESSFSRNMRRGGVIKHQQHRQRPRQSTGDAADGGKEQRCCVSFRQMIMWQRRFNAHVVSLYG